MDWGRFFLDNFYLLCIVIGMVIIAIQNFLQKDKSSLYCVLIVITALVLSFSSFFENYGRSINEESSVALATVFGFLGIVIRPLCLIYFIKFANFKLKIKDWILIAPEILVVLVYSTSLFIGVKGFSEIAFHYEVDPAGTELILKRGPLYLTSHIVSILYIVYLLVLSLKKIHKKDLVEALPIIVCAGFIIASAVLATIGIKAHLLNTTICISCLFYYIYLYMQSNKRDDLTGLYDRKTFYKDLNKYEKSIVGVIHLDMDGLKYLNDNYGHEAGDKGLCAISDSIKEVSNRNIFGYRIGGDEFVLLVFRQSEEETKIMAEKLHNLISEKKYYCSIGVAYKNSENSDYEKMFKAAEESMYKAKEDFYKNSKFERRKR